MKSGSVMTKFECVAVGLILSVALLLYLPGLSGPFLLDDYNTLKPLGSWVAIDTFEKLKLFLASGFTGPTGRPVSLFTFYLNSNTWPAAPFPFILTNVLIHISNGIILFLGVKKAFSTCEGAQGKVFPVALIVTALWVLHPFQVSTVLYIVQRMTLLSATFSLLAILVYLYAREALISSQNNKAIVLFCVVLVLALLAVFSKENAVVLPLQILILEVYLRILNPKSSKFHVWMIWAAMVPASMLVLAYPIKNLIFHVFDYLLTGQEQNYGRSFTMFERFWTQQRVLGDYINSILFPQMQTAGVFYDNYPVSRSIINPPMTLLWSILHGAALVLAFIYRKRLPWLFLGVFWFYASHVIESTFVMLELKFEHRNYMPSIGIIFILANLIFLIRNVVFRYGAVALALITYSFFLYMSSSLWGRPVQASMVWVAENPDSSRANEHAAHMAIVYEGNRGRAKELARRGVELSGQPRTELRFILTFCETYNGENPDWDGIAEKIKYGPTDWSLYPVLKGLLDDFVSEKCQLLDYEGYSKLLVAYKSNSLYQGHLSALLVDELEIKAAWHAGEKNLAFELDANRDELILPLAFKMNRALMFATFGELEFAASRLEVGIKVAERLKNENEFTLNNAREMLELIKKDIEAGNSDAK